MTTTPLPPSYGIWTTDADGNRVMGFTPEQFLSVWQSRADLEAKNAKLREALIACLEKGKRWHPCDPVVVKANAALESKQ